jgi:signal peptidase I
MSRAHFKKVEVRGDSMSPNYNDGDWLLFRLLPAKSKTDELVGKVVLIQRRSNLGEDFRQVKRVIKVHNENNETEFWILVVVLPKSVQCRNAAVLMKQHNGTVPHL